MNLNLRIFTGLISLLFTGLLLWSAASTEIMAQEATAVPPMTPPQEVVPPPPVMDAFLKDRQPPENSAPLAVTPCVGGFAGAYPCNAVDLLAFMPLANIGGGSGNDIWGWTDPVNGDEYALMGLSNGTSFIRISDPVNPVYLGRLPTHTSNSSWRDIKVYQNHAFIVSEASGHGMQVFDLTRLRGVASPPVTFTADAHYGSFGNAHNIVINDHSGFAYAVGANSCSGGLHMIDISTPTSPTFAGCFSSDGYTHDAQCVRYNGPDLAHIGKEVCFNANEDTITIVDVNDKANPVQLSRTGYAGSQYSHQGWLMEDHAIFLVNDELDEQNNGHNTRTYIWDIADLDAPVLIGNYTASTPAIDHNLYVRGSHIYQANYRAGLRILDGSNAASGSLSEVGYFDIYPANDNPNFNAAWSNFPYFDSDVVVVSGIEQGLFILEPDLSPDFRMETTAVTLDACGVDSDATTINLSSLYGYNSPVTLSVTGLPAGTSSAFSANPVTPTGSSTFTVTNTSAATGSYLLQMTASDGSLTADEYLKLTISQGVGMPTLTAPLDGSVDVAPKPSFAWTAVTGANGYDIEIASDVGFSTIVENASVVTNSYTPSASLNAGTTYYWRVRASNVCGGGAFSGVFSFTTGNVSCDVYHSSNVPLLIPPSGSSGTTTSTITAGASGAIIDVNVLNLVGTHTYMGDLDFYLDSPATTQVQLREQACATDEDFDLNYDDDGSGTPPCPPVDGGTYPPHSALSAFNGEDSAGAWTLTIEDRFNGDTGQLTSWSLEICFQVPCTAPNGVTDLMVSQSGGDVLLSWTATNADEYQVHRSLTPYFTPGPGTLHATTTNATYADPGVAGNGNNYFYSILAANSCGAAAGASNGVSEFEFAITPGT